MCQTIAKSYNGLRMSNRVESFHVVVTNAFQSFANNFKLAFNCATEETIFFINIERTCRARVLNKTAGVEDIL